MSQSFQFHIVHNITLICEYVLGSWSREGATVMVPENVKRILAALCEDANTTVFLISGKERKPLEVALGDIEALGIAAEQVRVYFAPLNALSSLLFSWCGCS